jgi:hypothetical protein
MRQRQSRRLQNQEKKARERRVATFLRYLDKRNARRGTPRRSLRIALKWDGAPPRVILFGEEGFFADDEAGRGPPKEADYRIREIDSDDNEDISTVGEQSGTSTSLHEATSSDRSSSLSSSASTRYQDSDEGVISIDSSTTDSTKIQELRACWEYPYFVGCPSTDSDSDSG